MTTATAPSAHDQALADVIHWSTRAADLEEESRVARAELEGIRSTAPADLLDDTDGALRRRLAIRGPELEMTLELNEATIGEARRREHEARRQILLAEADNLEPEIEQAREVVAAHETKTVQLLKELEDFTGATYRRVTEDMLVQEMLNATGSAVGLRIEPTVADGIGWELRRLERRQAILRAVADGRNPSTIVDLGPNGGRDIPVSEDELPPSVYGPAPVLAAPGWRRHVSAEDRAAALLATLSHLDEQIAGHARVYGVEGRLLAEGMPRTSPPYDMVHPHDMRLALRRWEEAIVRRNHVASTARVNSPTEVLALLGHALDFVAAPDPDVGS